jgi:putative ABC transport system permease protein
MHPLDIKLLRDLGTMKGQVVAVALVMACGLAVLMPTIATIVLLRSLPS